MTPPNGQSASGTGKRVLVTGSRVWEDARAIYGDLTALAERHGVENVTVIHGASGAADFMADGFARILGFAVERFPADWKTHGKGAGMRRNREMLDTHPDLVLAYPMGHSPGTRGCMAEAVRRGILVQSQDADSEETCWRCLGYGTVCDECDEPTCTDAVTCRVCDGSKVQPAGSSMAENAEPAPEPPTGGPDA